MKLINAVICLNVLVFAGMQTNSCMHVLVVCDQTTAKVCHNVTDNFLPNLEDNNDSSFLNISVVFSLDNFVNGLEVLSKHVEIENASFIIAFGGSFVVNMAGIVANDFGIPLLQYSTSKQRQPVSIQSTNWILNFDVLR